MSRLQVAESDMEQVEKVSKTMKEHVKAQPGKVESKLALYHLLTYYISHHVSMQQRARFQFSVSKMFDL